MPTRARFQLMRNGKPLEVHFSGPTFKKAKDTGLSILRKAGYKVAATVRKPNIEQGFWKKVPGRKRPVFVPIRASADYSRKRAGEKPLKRTRKRSKKRR